MKLKLTATIKKEALLPGMEMAIQDVDLQKELNKPGIVQQVNESDQALKQLQAKYSFKGHWDAANLEKDLKSFMEKFYPKWRYGIGVAGPHPLGEMEQREKATDNARLEVGDTAAPNVSFFKNADGKIYALAF